MAAEATDKDNLEADLKELNAMLALSKRPSVQTELKRLQAKLEQELKAAQAQRSVPQAEAEPQVATPTSPMPTEKPTTSPAAPSAPAPASVDVKSAGPWTEITTFALDLGGHNKPEVAVDVRLKGVEALPRENITCDFTEASFDLKVVGLDGTNYRFLRTNLDKDIVPAESQVKVKKNHVIVQLQKVKGEYGYDSWTDLCAKGKRKPTSSNAKSDPQDSIMNMMKDLYDDGDDNMKKIIGEAMYKAKTGEKYDPKADDLKLGSDI
jgi:calcyclin binding protein